MRVLLVVPLYPPTLGGAELQAQGLARQLVELGARVTVLTRPCMNEATVDTEAGVRVIRGLSAVPIGPLWGLTYMMRTGGWARRLAADWDVIHNQQVGLHSWPSLRVANSLGRPCLLRFACSGVGGDLATLSRQRFGRRMIQGLRGADRFVALASGGAEEVTAYGLAAERIRIIPNGVDLQRFAVQSWPPADLSAAIRLLFVGRLDPQKGLDLLVEALALLKQPERFCLRVVGEGPQAAKLRRQVRDAGLDRVVTFLGRQQDVVAQYAWSEVVVLPSRFEGMPNVVLEAMACARPVLATDVDGTRQLLADEVGGWLTPSGDVAALAHRLDDIASRRGQFAMIGLAGRRVVESRYSAASSAARYLREYEAILAARTRALPAPPPPLA
jgi:glycosyltransferase involved in cell wall biosynthesis